MSRSHHHAHPLYPHECATGRALDASTFAAVDADERRREAEYQRYLQLRETPEYQQQLAVARESLARKGGDR